MAEKNDSVPSPDGNDDAHEAACGEAEGVDLLGGLEGARTEKRAAEAGLARHVVWIVERRMAQSTRTPRLSRRGPPPPARAPDWKGPTSGQTYIDAKRLREATLKECKAGYRDTWGREFEEDLVDLGGEPLIGTTRKATDAEAREIYIRLQGAITSSGRRDTGSLVGW